MTKIESRYASAPPTRAALFAYGVVRRLIVIVSKLVFRMQVEGLEHVPSEGSFVMAPGAHRSNLDSLVISGLTKRRMRYMGKDSLWRSRFGDWFLSALGGFPVNRAGADREALRQCLEIAATGEPVVMFPEGTRETGPRIEVMHDGPVYVAAKAGIPIVPVGIGGSERAMPVGAKMVRPKKMSMIVGPPIPPPVGVDGGRVKRSQIRDATDELRDVLQDLFDRAQALAGAD
ncbi:MAG: lysophospholipid acyltransferase family protein [Actinomycetota bacterium]